MGSNMTRRLLAGGHRVVAYDPAIEMVQGVVKQGALSSPEPRTGDGGNSLRALVAGI